MPTPRRRTVRRPRVAIPALHRKLLRDLRRMWSQVLSIALVVGCGVMAAVSMRSTLGSLRGALERYYDERRFADVFATIQRAPDHVASRLAAISGVAAVQTRVSQRVTLDVPRLADLASGQIVSLPEGDGPSLNEVLVVRGRLPSRDARDEVLVSTRFASENALVPGESIGAVINGRWERLRIVGLATSPEFVFEASAGGFAVDNRHFGVLWMRAEPLAAAAGMTGAFNDVAIRLAAGATEPAVIAAVDRVLDDWGGAGAYGRADQVSNLVLGDEMRTLGTMATVFPLFFIGTAAFLLNVVLSRLVATQRDEIAALKAFGYDDRSIGVHYLSFALVSVAVGAVLGMLGGLWLGARYTRLYDAVFHVPGLAHRLSWESAAVSIAVTGGAALAGALVAVWSSVRIPPAEALRPPSPARYRPLLLERLGLAGRIAPSARMVIRALERRPWRTITAILGVGLSGALVVGGLSPWDAVMRVIEIQYSRVERADLTVAFTTARPARAARELASVDGVTRSEPYRAAAVRLRRHAHMRRASLMGLDGDGTLRQLIDVAGDAHPLPATGVVLSGGLAAAIEVRAGDTLRVELVELGGVARPLVVTAILDDMLGANAVMDRAALNALLREGDVVSGAYLAAAADDIPRVAARLKEMPGVAGVVSRAGILDTFRKQTQQSMSASVGVILFAACVIAAGVIYNQARIALSERARDLASLRVLGFTTSEVRRMLFGEQATVTLLGLPIGALVGTWFAARLMGMFEGERQRFPLALGPRSYLLGAAVVVAAALLAALPIRRRIGRLDLVAVLKTRE